MLSTPIRGTIKIDNAATPIPKPYIRDIIADFAPGLFLIYYFYPNIIGIAVLNMLYGIP
jgi:hypothetical protein